MIRYFLVLMLGVCGFVQVARTCFDDQDLAYLYMLTCSAVWGWACAIIENRGVA